MVRASDGNQVPIPSPWARVHLVHPSEEARQGPMNGGKVTADFTVFFSNLARHYDAAIIREVG